MNPAAKLSEDYVVSGVDPGCKPGVYRAMSKIFTLTTMKHAGVLRTFTYLLQDKYIVRRKDLRFRDLESFPTN